MSDANYWLGRLIGTLKQVIRETYNEVAVDELRAWAGSELCSPFEANEIVEFLNRAEDARTAGGKR